MNVKVRNIDHKDLESFVLDAAWDIPQKYANPIHTAIQENLDGGGRRFRHVTIEDIIKGRKI